MEPTPLPRWPAPCPLAGACELRLAGDGAVPSGRSWVQPLCFMTQRSAAEMAAPIPRGYHALGYKLVVTPSSPTARSA
jgi:hypothetical protein